jgi:putative endonuclease
MAKNNSELNTESTNRHFVYIVECSDGTLYTGYTVDIERRVDEHNSGVGAKYTRGRTPVKLIYKETFSSRSDAQKREYEIKKLPRSKKEELIS